MTYSEIEPGQAGADLDAVAASRHEAVGLSATTGTADRTYFALLGVLVGSLGLIVGLTAHTRPIVWILSLFVFIAVLQVAVYRYQRARRATARGWSSRFAWALGATIGLYGLGVLGASMGTVAPNLAIWLPYAALTAAPMLVAALVRGRAR